MYKTAQSALNRLPDTPSWNYATVIRIGSGEQSIPFRGKTRALAEQIVLHEMAGPAGPAISHHSEFLAFHKLQRPLHSVAGAAAVQALLSRALVLAQAELPRLASLKLNMTGHLGGSSDANPPLSGEEVRQGEVILVGNTVELLCLLLGEALTLRLLRDEWPEASFDKGSREEGNA